MLKIKRIYDQPAKDDGYRILVDRLWPRGISKERAAIDLWLKEIAPSAELRTWFGHKPERFSEFSHKYEEELSASPDVDQLRQKLSDKKHNVTLLYAAKDPVNNHAVVLKKFLE